MFRYSVGCLGPTLLVSLSLSLSQKGSGGTFFFFRLAHVLVKISVVVGSRSRAIFLPGVGIGKAVKAYRGLG